MGRCTKTLGLNPRPFEIAVLAKNSSTMTNQNGRSIGHASDRTDLKHDGYAEQHDAPRGQRPKYDAVQGDPIIPRCFNTFQ